MTTSTTDAVLAALRAASPAATGWTLAHRFDPSITQGHPDLSRAVLDDVAPERPLLVLEGNGHVAHVNSAALRAAGIDRDRADPPTARFVRDAEGEPTGRIEEMAAIAAFGMGMPIPTRAESVRSHRELFSFAAGKGVTLLHDCGIGMFGGPRDYEILDSAIDDDCPVRYRGMLVSNLYDRWQRAGSVARDR